MPIDRGGAAAPSASREGGALAWWLRSRWDRLSGPRRVAGIDLARGLAVLGMFAAHLLVIEEAFSFIDPGSWAAIAGGRSSILFATLAGVSIGLVTGGPTPFTGQFARIARLRLIVRAFLLWILGILLIATDVPVYVILPAYAVMFLLAVPLTRWGARPLAILAAVLALVMPWVQVVLDALPLWRTPLGNDLARVIGWHYPFTTWIAFVVAGLAAARADITRQRVQWLLLAVGGVLAAVGYGLHAATDSEREDESLSYWGALWTARPHSTGLLEVIGSGGFALAVIGACLLLCRTAVTWAVLPLRAVGAMPLTAYTLQLVVWAVIAGAVLDRVGDLSGFRELQPFWPFTLGTIALCTAWALLIGRGPLEAAVDRIARLLTRRPPADWA